MNILTWENIIKRLQYILPPEVLEKLRDNFALVKVRGKKVVIGYFDEDIYNDVISFYNYEIFIAINSLLGKTANIKYIPVESKYAEDDENEEDADNSFEAEIAGSGKAKGRKGKYSLSFILCTFACVILCFAIIAVGFNFAQNLSFKENFYAMSSTSIHDNLRIIQISDLHNASYGKDNEKLLKRIQSLKPDIIVMTGDIIDTNGSIDQIVSLCRKLSDISTTYYIYGNNEEQIAFNTEMTCNGLDDRFGFNDDNRNPQKLYDSDNGLKKRLEESGVKVLFNESDVIKIGNTTVEVYGALTSNPSAFWPYAGESFGKYVSDTADFKIFLSHSPYVFDTYDDVQWGDVALTGHTHGGVIRLPKIGSLYSAENGFFPELRNYYSYGSYDVDDTELIVSSGLSNKELYRFNNQPELVIVDVSKY